MDPSCCNLVDPAPGASDRPSDGKRKPPVRSKRSLENEIQELNLNLTIAQEALRWESEGRKRIEAALAESDQKHQRLMGEYHTIVQGLRSQMERTRKLQELGTILTPALAHDLKNLLAAISSLSQLCVERMNPTSPLEEHLRMIYENSQRADQLIAGYLDFVRTLKYDKLTPEPIDIHEVIHKMWEVAESASPLRHISFATRFDKNLPKFMGDPEKMERLLLNLFLNAIQAIPKRGRVNVRTRFLASQRVIEILIVDTGTGISKKHLKTIFEPFFTTKQGGTGLGLCACREIIEQFGGNIRIGSSSKQGTKVYIRLPAPVNRR
jgi:two-component system sensor histidine kinase HydH